MPIQISDTAILAIETFYENVAKKYRHTYDYSLMRKNIDEILGRMSKIENGLSRLTPSIKRWEGRGFMARTNGSKQWFFLYTIDGDTVYVLDACHAQNMKDPVDEAVSKVLRAHLFSHRMCITEGKRRKMVSRFTESDLRGMVMEAISNIINEEYKPIGSGIKFKSESGTEHTSVVTLEDDDSGQRCHIINDDHCYVLYNDSDDKVGTNCKPVHYIFPEAVKALQSLPLP